MSQVALAQAYHSIQLAMDAGRIDPRSIDYVPMLKARLPRQWSVFEDEINAALKQAFQRAAQGVRSQLDEEGAFLGDPELLKRFREYVRMALERTLPRLTRQAVQTARDAAAGLGSGVDWTLVNREAEREAREYLYEWVSNIEAQTVQSLQQQFGDWMSERETFPQLLARVEAVINNPVRAEMIATTEATRLYASANARAWERTGAAGATFLPPFHVRCRCYIRPHRLPNGETVMVWFTAEDERVCTALRDAPWGDKVAGCAGLNDRIISDGPYLGRMVAEAEAELRGRRAN